MTPLLSRRIESAVLRLYTEILPYLPPEGCHAILPAGSALIHFRIETEVVIEKRPLTACETSIHDLLTTIGKRMTAKQIKEHFDSHDELWGMSTIQNALAELRSRELVDNNRDCRGYGLCTLPN